jgi:hypothetical protein
MPEAEGTQMRQIGCVKVETNEAGSGEHRHVVAVGFVPDLVPVGIDEVRSMLLRDYFVYTLSSTTGRSAEVEPYTCECGVETLKSVGDVVADNDLLHLAVCAGDQ